MDPGSRVELDLGTGTSTTRRYYEPRPDPDAGRVRTLDAAVELVEPLLARSGREHLESDVPIACFLSGGVDSALVLAATRAATTRPIQAFTIGFEDPRFDEAPRAREVAASLGVPLHVEVLDEEAMLVLLPDALAAFDEPFGDSSSLATFLLARVVSRTHKVALGGDGGDEVFAGYRKHRIVRLRRQLARVPGLRSVLSEVLRRIPGRPDRTDRIGEVVRTLRRVGRGLQGADVDGYSALTQVASLAETAQMMQTPGAASLFESVAARYEAAHGDTLQRTQIADLGNVLPNDMLTKVDRASMANRLEVRVPMLDHRLVEVGLGLRSELTLGTSGKQVLRAIHRRRFAALQTNRAKQGFSVPVERWLRTRLATSCARLFERRRLERYGLLSPHTLADGRHRALLATHPYLVWHAFAMAAWCEVHLGGGIDALRDLVRPA